MSLIADELADLLGNDPSNWCAVRSGVVAGVTIERGAPLHAIAHRLARPTFHDNGVSQFVFADRSGVQLSAAGWQLVWAG